METLLVYLDKTTGTIHRERSRDGKERDGKVGGMRRDESKKKWAVHSVTKDGQ